MYLSGMIYIGLLLVRSLLRERRISFCTGNVAGEVDGYIDFGILSSETSFVGVQYRKSYLELEDFVEVIV